MKNTYFVGFYIGSHVDTGEQIFFSSKEFTDKDKALSYKRTLHRKYAHHIGRVCIFENSKLLTSY